MIRMCVIDEIHSSPALPPPVVSPSLPFPSLLSDETRETLIPQAKLDATDDGRTDRCVSTDTHPNDPSEVQETPDMGTHTAIAAALLADSSSMSSHLDAIAACPRTRTSHTDTDTDTRLMEPQTDVDTALRVSDHNMRSEAEEAEMEYGRPVDTVCATFQGMSPDSRPVPHQVSTTSTTRSSHPSGGIHTYTSECPDRRRSSRVSAVSMGSGVGVDVDGVVEGVAEASYRSGGGVRGPRGGDVSPDPCLCGGSVEEGGTWAGTGTMRSSHKSKYQLLR